ncbi:MAG: inositol monophosphatase family protein [Actinomycetota bacterium]
MSPRPAPADLRDLARRVAADIADYLREEVVVGHAPDTKSSSTDFVTAIDRESERRIVEAITEVRPDDAFMGEEGTDTPGTTGVRWVIDPIDGTTNFVHAHPGFSVSIAAEVDGRVVAGAVADPMHDELFDAALGEGARCNGRPITATAETELSRALVATGFSYDPDRRVRQAEALMTILPRIADIRRMGSAATDLCGVAIGRVDGSFEIGLSHWDLAAGALIAAEAGAVVRWPGEDGMTIAAAPGVAAELIPLIESVGIV